MSVNQTREQAHLSSDEGERAREAQELHHEHRQIASPQELPLTVSVAHIQEELRLEREQTTKLIQKINVLQEELRLEREQTAKLIQTINSLQEELRLERAQTAQAISSLQEELRLERAQTAQAISSLQEELRLERKESARRLAQIEQLQSRHRICFQRLLGYFLVYFFPNRLPPYDLIDSPPPIYFNSIGRAADRLMSGNRGASHHGFPKYRCKSKHNSSERNCAN